MREFITGADAISRAALDAGCVFFAGYPISPATSILLQMVRTLPRIGGVAIQAEDEISAISMCIGAVMTGARAMTATSGPGISLYSENIGVAIMGEVPLVIVDVQRLGPATGGATTVSQGDVQFLRWGTSGGYPVIVLCPTNVVECYSLTRMAFDFAERFRVPVFLATDKETVMNRSTVDRGSFDQKPVQKRSLAPADVSFTPYSVEQLSDVPPMSPFGGPHLVRFSTSSHNEHGYMSKKTKDIRRLNRHLAAKIEARRDEIALVKADIQTGADTLIVSYGISACSMEESVEIGRSAGMKISALTVYSLWPVPERDILDALAGIKRVVVAELNQGQYRREIERLAGDSLQVVGVHRVDGSLLSPEEILEQCRA